MKKSIILSMVFLFYFSLIFGQNEKKEKERIEETKKELKAEKDTLRELEGDEVNYKSKDRFITDFGNVLDVSWIREGIFDKATFTKDGEEIKAYYDFNPELVGTTHHVTFAEIPAEGQQEIERDYKGYEIGTVIFYNDNEVNDSDMILFGSEFAHEDNYFVELIKDSKIIILRVNSDGEVFYFMDAK